MKNRKRGNCKSIYECIKTVTKNKYPEKLNSNNKTISLLWCPMYNAFPGKIFFNSLRGNIDPKNKKKSSLRKEYFIEPLSEYEIEFLNAKNIDINRTILDIETGSDRYKKNICKPLPIYDSEKKYNCRVAGISGTAILHFTLAHILNINFKSVFIGQMLEMVPIHHSIEDICYGLHDFNYFLKCNDNKNSIKMKLFDNHTDMLQFVKKNIIDASVKEKKVKYTKKKRNVQRKTKKKNKY